PIFSAGLIAGQVKKAEAMEKAFKSAKQQEIISKQNAITATINLYKALGGGWDNKDLPDLPSLLPAGR
ncbi:MAG TPA: hypothetical protein PLV58_10290, partial [Campylobacterales bacterium]|nr:hypothetical protein [Campylobacterales bacterium]